MKTYVAAATAKTDDLLIDQVGSPLALGFSQYSFTDIDDASTKDTARMLKMRQLTLGETNQGFRTNFELDVHLPTYKNFHTTDLLQINLGGAAYTTTTGSPAKRVYCEVLDLNTKKYIPQIETCNADDLASILIKAQADT